MEFHDLWKIINHRIMNPQVCRIIVSLFEEKNRFNNILEIGRSKGHSYGLFKFLAPHSCVVSIDPIYHKEVDKVVELFKDKNYMFITGTSYEVARLRFKFDLVLIDGDHSYEWCLKDWNNIQNHLAENAIVLFDDLDHPKGCGKVFYEIKNHKKEAFMIKDQGSDNVSEGFGIVYT